MRIFPLFLLTILFLFTSFQALFVGQDVSGQYRLKYKGDKFCGGWPIDSKEELLTLNKDSTFVLELISQGGFEVYPDSGTWTMTNTSIVLKTKITRQMIECEFTPPIRNFLLVKGGLLEPKCTERRLRKTVWRKE